MNYSTYLTLSCFWIQILWNIMSSFLALMSAFISIATCLGNTESKRRSWKRHKNDTKRRLFYTLSSLVSMSMFFFLYWFLVRCPKLGLWLKGQYVGLQKKAQTQNFYIYIINEVKYKLRDIYFLQRYRMKLCFPV